MSMSFQNDLSEQLQSFIRELFEDQTAVKIAAIDHKNVLLQGELLQSKMKQVANELNEPVSVELNDIGEIKTMSDGSRYQVTKTGWKKLV